MNRLCIICCLLFFFLPSCKDTGTSHNRLYLGTFAYKASDTLEVVVAQGNITLYTDNSKVTGYWRFDDGRSGELAGTASNGNIALNLNPRFVDNNLILQGILSGDTLAGNWQQIGFPGVTAGTFLAVRKQ